MMRLQNILIIVFLFMLGACSVTKQVPDNDALYTGAKIKLEHATDSTKFNKKEITAELEELVRPAPNKSFLGVKLKLMIFNMVDTPKKEKGLGHWLKYKVGEPPVLASSVNLEKNRLIMQNRLENRGFFKTEMKVDTVIKNKKMEATYSADVQQRYLISHVYYPTDSGQIYNIIRRLGKTSQLKPGKPYNLTTILAERERIDARLKDNGFYYFTADDIIADIDSTIGHHKIDVYIRIKKESPFKHLVNYKINDVIVYADYDINKSDTTSLTLDNTKNSKAIQL